MGVFESMRRRSSSIKDTATLKSVTTNTSSGYSSRYSSAPTSRCTSPISRTRSNELSFIISRSIKYPSSPILEPTKSKSISITELRTPQEKGGKTKDEPEGFRNFLNSAKNSNPNYNKRKILNIQKPISKNDQFGWFMDRKRGVFEEI